MLQCPRCSSQFPDGMETELRRHLRDFHRMSDGEIRRSGWFEAKKEVMTDDGLKEKAELHRLAALKNQTKPLSVPIIPTPEKKEIQIPAGWVKVADSSYRFEREVSHYSDPERSCVKILTADLNERTGKATLRTIRKSTDEVADAVEKKNILQARLSSFCPSDPGFVTVANELHNQINTIGELKKQIRDDITTEIVLEETSRLQPFDSQNMEWQEQFMRKTCDEADRLQKAEKGKEDQDET